MGKSKNLEPPSLEPETMQASADPSREGKDEFYNSNNEKDLRAKLVPPKIDTKIGLKMLSSPS
jgi:hypothetical protein